MTSTPTCTVTRSAPRACPHRRSGRCSQWPTARRSSRWPAACPTCQSLPLDVAGRARRAQLITKDGLPALQYGSGQGIAELREQICQVMALEGIRAHPDDVTVTVGSQMALDLVTRIFCDPGDVILAEAPSYVGALATFASYQAQVVHIEMDDDGLIPSAGAGAIDACRAAGRRIKFLYTIPNFHNPAGVTLSRERRLELAAICREPASRSSRTTPTDCWVSTTRSRRAIRADDADNVIYLGLVLQDLRAGTAGRLGARAARGPGEAGAGQRECDAEPAGVQPDDGVALPGQLRLAGPGQGLPADLRRRRDAMLAALEAAHARWHHLDPARRRLLRLGHPA